MVNTNGNSSPEAQRQSYLSTIVAEVDSVGDQLPNVSEELVDLIRGCLELEPARRYTWQVSMRAMLVTHVIVPDDEGSQLCAFTLAEIVVSIIYHLRSSLHIRCGRLRCRCIRYQLNRWQMRGSLRLVSNCRDCELSQLRRRNSEA